MTLSSNRFMGFNSTQERSLRALFDSDSLGAGGVGTTELANGAVTTAKLGAGAVTNAKVDAAAAIAATKLAAAEGTDGLAAGTVQAALQAVYTAVANLDTWAAALATKLNADAGVTDTDYDTDPQA
jgi:hypothetical protein